jgi:hypothetical protein
MILLLMITMGHRINEYILGKHDFQMEYVYNYNKYLAIE